MFTAEQAERGRALYEEICIECHLSSLAGADEAPPLRGADFLDAWGFDAVANLADTIRVTMPPENRNSLTPQQTYDLAAFVLQQNGAAAGDEALTADSAGLGAALGSLGMDGAAVPETDAAAVADRDVRAPRRSGGGGIRQASGRARDRGFRTGHRGDASRPGPRRLADVPAHLRRPGSQPARPDRHRQRGRSAPGVVVGDGGRRESADAARVRRRHVPGQSGQHHPGAGGRTPAR